MLKQSQNLTNLAILSEEFISRQPASTFGWLAAIPTEFPLSLANPITIFDENNNILSQTEKDVFTNFAIKLKIEGLNTEYFKYYKVVCVERNNVDNTQSAFIEGIHPTTDDTIVYTHSGSSSDDKITRGNVSIKRRIDFNIMSN